MAAASHLEMVMPLFPALAVFVGAGFGALLRWALSLAFNPLVPTLPLGTLASNILGGFLIGMASAFFMHNTSLPPEWRLFAITGFLGGLTTFSTFSAEVVDLLARQQYLWATCTAALHMFGSFAMTALGMIVCNAILMRH